ncbi:MAG: major capsid protein E [Rhodobacteraceae bacterium]|nr:major capsid protein E [Paracoccaceae bacterium]MAY44648.1 major capsid protein E [Paracoccaceae bacterium]
MLDIFNDDAFGIADMTDAVNLIPNQWGRIGAMGLFRDRPIRTTMFQVEQKNGVLQIIQSSERGSRVPGARIGKRDLRPFSTHRFALTSNITADDVQNLRAFGSATELVQVMDIVAERQVDLRSSIDITREYLRAGALQGQVKDADGTVLTNLFTEFGITQKVVDFVFGTGTTDLGAKVEEVTDHIRLNMLGDTMTSVHALCSPTFWTKLMGHADFRERYKYFENTRGADPQRADVSGGFEWKGVVWEKYLANGPVPQEDGSVVNQSFIPEGDARFFPVGTQQTFRQYNAPADYIETVNTPGLPFYSMVDVKKRTVEVEVQTQTIPLCVRPGTLVRGHSST